MKSRVANPSSFSTDCLHGMLRLDKSMRPRVGFLFSQAPNSNLSALAVQAGAFAGIGRNDVA